MQFADWAPFLVDAPQSERDFADTEFSPGLPYYKKRLQRMGFEGKRVLDAGCGMGQYSVALASFFEEVEGIDRNASRLAVAAKMCAALGLNNTRFSEGSVEALPYEDGNFDAVFCYGVIMFTDMKKTLAEFHRVLAPGGQLYVCLNGDGWNWKMLQERCTDNAALRKDIVKALYTTLIQRHMSVLQQHAASPEGTKLRIVLRHMEKFGLSVETLADALSPAMMLRLPELVAEVENISPDFRKFFLEDYFAFLLHAQWPQRLLGKTRGYLPEDMETLLASAGFCHWAWAPEAQLFCVERLAEVEPRYAGMYEGYPAVWEFIARKADDELVPDATRITAEALAAGKAVFCPPLKRPVVYSSTVTFPRALIQRLEKEARSLGGDAFFKRQVDKLKTHAPDEEALLIKSILYVQKALYRHPFVQPSTREGNISPLAALLAGIGRCGHAAAAVCAFTEAAQIPCRIRKLRRHIVAEAFVGGRWVLADADAFKHGIIPVNRDGKLLSLDDLATDPWRIDHFPATGWSCPAEAPQACTPLGYPVRGYVTSGSWHERGYLSNYFTPSEEGYPPSQPVITEAVRRDGHLHLRWNPATGRGEGVLHYAVCVSSSSRNWTEAQPNENILRLCPQDICCQTTREEAAVIAIPASCPGPVFVNVTAVGERFAKDNQIFYWPGEETMVYHADAAQSTLKKQG